MHLLKGQPRGLTGAARAGRSRAVAGRHRHPLRRRHGDLRPCRGAARARRDVSLACASPTGWRSRIPIRSISTARRCSRTPSSSSIRLLGGASYWRYGLDEAVRLARANGTKLVVVPGDATWDAALAARGHRRRRTQARKLWSYLVEGGSENLANALRYLRASDRRGREPRRRSRCRARGLSRGDPSPLGRGWPRSAG